MRAVLQRVSAASVHVGNDEIGRIGSGLLVFVGVAKDDGLSDVDYLVEKILNLKVFGDHEGRMNQSVVDTGGEVLAVSQVTLYGHDRGGTRLSFEAAAPLQQARVIYDEFVAKLSTSELKVETGQFQSMMAVELVNDGPVTLFLDSRSPVNS